MLREEVVAAVVLRCPAARLSPSLRWQGQSLRRQPSDTFGQTKSLDIRSSTRSMPRYRAAPSALSSRQIVVWTLIEVQLGPKGLGEGKTSLTTKVIVDKDANTIALDNYAATPAILKNVKY